MDADCSRWTRRRTAQISGGASVRFVTWWDSFWSTALGGVIAALVGGGVSLALAAWAIHRAKGAERRERLNQVVTLMGEMYAYISTKSDAAEARGLRVRWQLALDALIEDQTPDARGLINRWAFELGERFMGLVEWEPEAWRQRTDDFGPRITVAIRQLKAWYAKEITAADLLMPWDRARQTFALEFYDKDIER